MAGTKPDTLIERLRAKTITLPPEHSYGLGRRVPDPDCMEAANILAARRTLPETAPPEWIEAMAREIAETDPSVEWPRTAALAAYAALRAAMGGRGC